MGLPVEVNNLMLGSLGGYTVGRSLRFRSSASATLTRTPSSAGNRKTWTWSGWVKRGTFGTDQWFLRANSTGSDFFLLGFGAANQFYSSFTAGVSAGGENYTAAVFRDPSAWYHCICAFDSTQATASNRVKLYVNGVQQTLSVSNAPTLNADYQVNSTNLHYIGGFSGNYADFYLAEVNLIDGQQLTPSSFGAYDTNGVWQPKKYSGTYGTNGFYLPFSNTTSTTTLVQDSSGNGNNWTPNNISLTSGTTYDSMIDSPTVGSTASNYAVLNPLDTGSSGSVSAGNLTHSSSGGGVTRSNASIRVPSSGKFYAEFINSSATNANIGLGFGVSADSVALNAAYNAANSYHFYASNAAQAMNSGTTISISSWTNSANQTFQLSVDADNSKVWIGQNNVWWDSAGGTTGNPSTGANPTFTVSTSGFKIFTSIDTTSSVNWIANFGQRPFSYTPPSGFKALNTYNLPDSTIKNGNKFFDTSLFTGTSGNVTISGLGFQPDFVWLKARSNAQGHTLFDSVRGANKYLQSNLTNAEATMTNPPSFTSDGWVSTTDTHTNGYTYAAWQWKGGGTAVTNNSGTITSQVSANTSAGFSVVTMTYSSVAGTVGHGLGVAPSMIIVKRRDSSGSWYVAHSGLTNMSGYYLLLESTAAQGAASWGGSPTSTVFYMSNSIFASGNYVAYCFAAVRGYSAFGSYTGNGSADGPFIYTGFRPRWIMGKRTNTTGVWWIYDTSRDTYNVVGNELIANASDAETAGNASFDILSNGFKLRTTGVGRNGSGDTFIYAAFAENPFNYSRAR